MVIAITREVSPSMGQCELTHIPRQDIDIDLARAQHVQYERVLVELGCRIRRLPVEPSFPDSVFVEDTAVVLDEVAIIARPGAETRRDETKNVSAVLSEYRTIFKIVSPATLEGGDVLQIGRTLFVGVTERSNELGVKQLIDLVSPYGYEVIKVQVDGCLHLKSAVTHVGEDTLLINRSWIDIKPFQGKSFIDVDPGEPFAANALLIGDDLVYPAIFPETRRRLEDRGFSVREVDVSEMQKAEGAMTCCSLIFRERIPIKNEREA
ncbi:MAG: dimethylargininase [Anaerolineales bacterium]|nr:dimethylargininase [Anaerolineales bacterium]